MKTEIQIELSSVTKEEAQALRSMILSGTAGQVIVFDDFDGERVRTFMNFSRGSITGFQQEVDNRQTVLDKLGLNSMLESMRETLVIPLMLDGSRFNLDKIHRYLEREGRFLRLHHGEPSLHNPKALDVIDYDSAYARVEKVYLNDEVISLLVSVGPSFDLELGLKLKAYPVIMDLEGLFQGIYNIYLLPKDPTEFPNAFY